MLTGILGLAIFFLTLYGLFQIFDIDFYSLSNQGLDYLMKEKNDINIRDKVSILKGKKKENFIVKEVKRLNYILEVTNKKKQLPVVFCISCTLALAGIGICIALNNMYLIPVLSIGLFLTPFFVMETRIDAYKQELTGEIETTLSIITTSYLRTENIIMAVNENIDYINEPIKTYFKEFIIDTTVNPNVELALKKLQNKIENKIFKEWVEALISCQSNHMLKTTLTPIVRKISDLRIVNEDLETMLVSPKRTFLTMCVMVSSIPLILGVSNKELLMSLLKNDIGKIAISIGVAIMIFCIYRIIKIAKPLEE